MPFDVALIALLACAVLTSRLVRRRRREVATAAAHRRELELRDARGARVFRYRVTGPGEWVRLGIGKASAAPSKTITLELDPGLRLESFDGTLWTPEAAELRLLPLAGARWLDLSRDRRALEVPNGTELFVLGIPRPPAESDPFRGKATPVLAAYEGTYLAAPSEARSALELEPPAEPRSGLALTLGTLMLVYLAVETVPAALAPWAVGAAILIVGVVEVYSWLARE